MAPYFDQSVVYDSNGLVSNGSVGACSAIPLHCIKILLNAPAVKL